MSPLVTKILLVAFNSEIDEMYKRNEVGRYWKKLYYLGDGMYPNGTLFAKRTTIWKLKKSAVIWNDKTLNHRTSNES